MPTKKSYINAAKRRLATQSRSGAKKQVNRFKGKYAGPDKYKGVIPPHLKHKYKGKYFGKEANKGANVTEDLTTRIGRTKPPAEAKKKVPVPPKKTLPPGAKKPGFPFGGSPTQGPPTKRTGPPPWAPAWGRARKPLPGHGPTLPIQGPPTKQPITPAPVTARVPAKKPIGPTLPVQPVAPVKKPMLPVKRTRPMEPGKMYAQ